MSADLVDPQTLTRDELLAHLQSTPTVTVEFAGACMGISRPAAYRAAEAGQIKVLRLGRRLLVPTRWLERALMLVDDRHDSAVLLTGEPVSCGHCAGISEACPQTVHKNLADGAS
jgi:hypothetical protein